MQTNIDNTQAEAFRIIVEELLISNKLQVCVDELKDSSILDVNILRLINNDPSIIPREITEILNIPKSTLTNAINRLVKKELLERKLNQDDLRSFRLELTSNGKKAMQAHRIEERKLISRTLSLLNENEIPVMMDILVKLVRDL